MPRTIVAIHPFQNGGDVFSLSEATAPMVGPIGFSPLTCAPDNALFVDFRQNALANGLTATVGRQLFDALSVSAPVKQELSVCRAQNRSFYIDDQSPQAQALPWEALCYEDGTFHALELGMGRLVGRLQAAERAQRTFDPPIRVLAILAAAGGSEGDTALPEWEALFRAFERRAGAFDFTIHVLGCDDDVKQAIEELDDPRVEFSFLTSEESVVDEVEDFAPHVLHVFCHGFAGQSPQLELATRRDQVLGHERGSLRLRSPDFRDMLNPAIWLVTLNCCLGAAASADSQPLARQLAHAGFPAVVGMQEPIDRRDAHLFCRAFYRSVLSHLNDTLAGAQAPVEIEWVKTLAAPRRKLHGKHCPDAAADCKQWTLPVLYVRPEPFEVRGVVSAGSGLDVDEVIKIQAEIDQLEQVKASLPGVPANILNQIDQRIAGLRQQLLGGAG